MAGDYGSRATVRSVYAAPSGVYAGRVRELVDDWCRLAGTPAAANRLGHLIESVEGKTRALRAAARRLCADGSPIEVCERLAAKPLGPSITCEGHSCEQMLEEIDGAVRCVRATGQILFEDVPARANAAVWIGAESDESGCMQSKVYFSLDGRVVGDAASRCERALAFVTSRSTPRVGHALRFLQARGYIRMLALSFRSDGFAGAKLYARFRSVGLDDLSGLSEIARAPFEPFDRYVRRVLRRPRTWFDARAGAGIAFDAGGEPCGAVLYHYPHGYFASDEELRSRLLEIAPEFAWNPASYRSVSRLIDARDGSRVRSLLAFGVTSTRGSRFHAYGRTGHLAA